jgi:WD40 repeat protein
VGYAFISYSRKDRDVVEQLAAQLGKNGIEVWFDHHLVYGEKFPDRIEKEIAGSAVVVPIMSANSATSEWVPKELALAHKYQRMIMPISLDGNLFDDYKVLHVELLRGGSVLSNEFLTDMREACRPSVQFAMKSTLTGHHGAVRSVAWAPVADLLASAGDDHTLRLWDPATGKERISVVGGMSPTWPVAFMPDGTRFAAPSRVQAGIHLWDANSATLVRSLGNHDKVRSFAFSPDGRLLATGGDDRAQVWDAMTGTHRQSLTARTMRPAWPVSFAPTGALLAVANHGSNSVSLWGTKTLDRVHRTDNKSATVTALCFDPSGQLVLSGLADGGFELDTIDGASIRDLRLHGGGVRAIACSAKDKVFATAGADGVVKLISLLTGEELQVLSGHSGEVCSLAFSPDGTRLATAGVDGTVKIWHRK